MSCPWCTYVGGSELRSSPTTAEAELMWGKKPWPCPRCGAAGATFVSLDQLAELAERDQSIRERDREVLRALGMLDSPPPPR